MKAKTLPLAYLSGRGAPQAGGRFLIYSQDWDQHVRGGLHGENLYNRTFAANQPGSITLSGDRFIYSRQPILTFSIANGQRQYGSLALINSVPGTPTGLVNGDTTAEAFSGAPTVTDMTALGDGVGIYAGGLGLSRGSLLPEIGYGFAFAPSPLTITPAPLTITADRAAQGRRPGDRPYTGPAGHDHRNGPVLGRDKAVEGRRPLTARPCWATLPHPAASRSR